MHRVHICDDSFVGFGDGSQLSYLTLGGHSHFEHTDILIPFGTKKAERQAEFIVKVAYGTQNRERLTKYGVYHLFGSRLAGAAGHTNDRHSPSASNVARECL